MVNKQAMNHSNFLNKMSQEKWILSQVLEIGRGKNGYGFTLSGQVKNLCYNVNKHGNWHVLHTCIPEYPKHVRYIFRPFLFP